MGGIFAAFLNKFMLQTGGQDDLVTIFSPVDQRVVARCQGHSSFVSSVFFDPERTDERTYRFGSVGEDNKLILVSNGIMTIISILSYELYSGISPAVHCIAQN